EPPTELMPFFSGDASPQHDFDFATALKQFDVTKRVRQSSQLALLSQMKIGPMLTKLKAETPHAEWLKMVKRTKCSVPTVEVRMRLYKFAVSGKLNEALKKLQLYEDEIATQSLALSLKRTYDKAELAETGPEQGKKPEAEQKQDRVERN